MIKKIDHIAVAVRLLDDALPVFEKLLGSIPEVEEIDDQGVSAATFNLDGVNLELIEPTSDDSPISKFLENRGEGVHHICLEVDDLETAVDELVSKGFELIEGTPSSGVGGAQIVFLHPKTTGGILFELRSTPE